MPGDADYSLTSHKRKLYSWLIGLTKDNADSFNDSWQQSKQITPDTKDIVNLLRSTGFRTVDMKVEKTSSQSSLTSLVCRVTVKCARSGMQVVLESEGECRCPEEAHADNASTWCVLSPSNSKDTLNKSGSVAGSSLLPELPANVSELVGSATRCLLRLLEEPEGQTPSRGRASLGGAGAGAGGGSGGRRRAPLPRTSSIAAGDPGRLGAQLAHHRSLDDMHWEPSGSVGSPATPRPVRALSDAAFSPSPSLSAAALSHSRSDGQLAQAGAATGASTSGAAAADVDMASDTSATMDVGASFVAPPRRQSTTLEDYHAFKKPLCDPVEISIESTESVPSIDLPIEPDVNDPQRGPLPNQENLASLPPHKAKEVIKKAEGAIQNMSEVMEMLKKWMISEEGPSSEVPSAKAKTSKAKPIRVPTSRATVSATRPTTRKSAVAGAAGHVKQQAVASRSPSASSAGSGASSTSAGSARGTRTLQSTAKTPKPNAACARPSKPLAKPAVTSVRRRSLEDAVSTPRTPRPPGIPLARRPRVVATPYVATAPSFGLAARSPRPSPAAGQSPSPSPNPSPNPSPRPRPRARALEPPPKPKRASMD